MDLIGTVDQHYLLIGVEEEKKVFPQKPSSKSVTEKAIKELG